MPSPAAAIGAASVLSVGTAPSTRSPRSSSQSESTKRDDRTTTRRKRRGASVGLRECLRVSVVLAGIAIASSIMTANSCRFFSYRDTARPTAIDDNAFDDNMITAATAENNNNNNNNNNDVDNNHLGDEPMRKNATSRINHGDIRNLEWVADPVVDLQISVFGDLRSADVGLFSYSPGDSSAGGVCLRYREDEHELSTVGSAETGWSDTKNGAWIGARICSVLAPVIAFVAVAEGLFRRCRGDQRTRCGGIATAVLFATAGILQLGTFAVVTAPRIAVDGDGDVSVCDSATTVCRLEAGAWCSLGSALAYILLAAGSASTLNTPGDRGNANATTTTLPGKSDGPSLVGDTSSDSSSSGVSGRRKRAIEQSVTGNGSSSSSYNSSSDRDGQQLPQQARDQYARNVSGGIWLANDRGADRDPEITIQFSSSIFSDESTILIRVDGTGTENDGEVEDRTLENLEAGGTPSDPWGGGDDDDNDDNRNKRPKDLGDDDDDHSIIREVTSIETEFVRPGPACCYCADSVAERRPPKPTATGAAGTRKLWRRSRAMASMLSDDDDDDEEELEEDGIEARFEPPRRKQQQGDETVVDAASGGEEEETVYRDTGTTIEECEARFLAELEGSQMEHTNWENSPWKKGFEFVRS